MQTPTTIQPQDLSWAEIKNIVLAVSDQIKETGQQIKADREQAAIRSSEIDQANQGEPRASRNPVRGNRPANQGGQGTALREQARVGCGPEADGGNGRHRQTVSERDQVPAQPLPDRMGTAHRVIVHTRRPQALLRP